MIRRSAETIAASGALCRAPYWGNACSLKYLDPIFAPFRAVKNKIMGVQNIKGNIHVDVNRVKSLGKNAQANAKNANAK